MQTFFYNLHFNNNPFKRLLCAVTQYGLQGVRLCRCTFGQISIMLKNILKIMHACLVKRLKYRPKYFY